MIVMIVGVIALALVAVVWVAFRLGSTADPEDADWYQGSDGSAWYDPSDREDD